MGRENNFGNKRNSNGFDKRPQDTTKGGRKPSLRKQLEEIITDEGSYTIEEKNVLKINDNGSIVVKATSSEQMARKLVDWAMSNKGNDSIKAIQMIMEQIDGKPRQTIDQRIDGVNPIVTYRILNPEDREKRIDELTQKEITTE